jgi:hypothetical protein
MFRFTIRDLLWLMVVVALGPSWWLDRTAVKSFYSAIAGDQARTATVVQKEINSQNKRLSLLGSAIEKAGFRLKESADPMGRTLLISLEPNDTKKSD